MSIEEIKGMFPIETDFTPEEEAEATKENERVLKQ